MITLCVTEEVCICVLSEVVCICCVWLKRCVCVVCDWSGLYILGMTEEVGVCVLSEVVWICCVWLKRCAHTGCDWRGVYTLCVTEEVYICCVWQKWHVYIVLPKRCVYTVTEEVCYNLYAVCDWRGVYILGVTEVVCIYWVWLKRCVHVCCQKQCGYVVCDWRGVYILGVIEVVCTCCNWRGVLYFVTEVVCICCVWLNRCVYVVWLKRCVYVVCDRSGMWLKRCAYVVCDRIGMYILCYWRGVYILWLIMCVICCVWHKWRVYTVLLKRCVYIVCDWRDVLYVVCDWSGVYILCMTEEMCRCCVYNLKKNSPLPFPCTCHNPRWCWADVQWWARCCPWIRSGWSAEWGRQSPCRRQLWPHPAQGSWFCGAGSVPDTPAVSAPRCKPTTHSWQHCPPFLSSADLIHLTTLSFWSSADLIHLTTLSILLVIWWSDTPDNTVCFLVIWWSDTPDNTVCLSGRLLIWYTWQHCPSFLSSADLIHLTTLSVFWSSADLIHLTILSIFLVVCWSETPDNTVRLNGRLLIWYTWQHCPSFWSSADLIHLTILSVFWSSADLIHLTTLSVFWSSADLIHLPTISVSDVFCCLETHDNNVHLWCLPLPCFSPLALWRVFTRQELKTPKQGFALTGTVVVSRILLVKISIYCKQNQQTVRLTSCYFAWPVLKK